MGVSIKSIGNGNPYYIRFKNTKVYKRIYGSEEVLFDEYNYEKGDEFMSEIIWRVPISRGLFTWFNFNKVERLEQLRAIDYHKNVFMGEFKYESDGKIEYVVSHATDGMPLSLTIQKNKFGYMADILITYENWYYRIHLEKPTDDSFDQ